MAVLSMILCVWPFGRSWVFLFLFSLGLPIRMKFWLKMKFIETKLWKPQNAQTRSDNRCGDIEVLYQRANG